MRQQIPSNILLPRFDTLGDIVLLQGFIQMILNNYPDTRITMLVREGYDQLAVLFPSQIIWQTTNISIGQALVDDDYGRLSVLLENIADAGFDALFVTTYNRTWLDDILAARLSGVFKVALGQARNLAPWEVNLHAHFGLPGTTLYDLHLLVDENTHEIDKYQILANTLFDNVTPLPKPKLYLANQRNDSLNSLVDDKNFIDLNFYVCVTTCTRALPFKSWPIERFVEIMIWLHTEYSLNPILVGHVSESTKIQSIACLIKDQGVEPFVWLGEDGELDVMARIMKKSKFYFGNDTGPMHIAAALGIPTVGVFGGGHWPRFLPVGDRAVGVAAEIPCFGCHWGDCIFEDAPCVKLVTVEDVKRAIQKVTSKDLLLTNYFAVMDECSERLKEFIDKCIALAREKRNEKSRSELVSRITVDNLESSVHELEARLNLIQTSLSWRITRPLRWLGNKLLATLNCQK